MPITVSWDKPDKTIARLDFEGVFNMQDVFDAWETELDLMNSVNHPVYSLNVFTDIRMMPSGFSMRRIIQFIQKNQSPNLQMTVQVAENRTVRRVLQAIAGVMMHDVRVVKSLDEAYEIMAHHKPRLQEAS